MGGQGGNAVRPVIGIPADDSHPEVQGFFHSTVQIDARTHIEYIALLHTGLAHSNADTSTTFTPVPPPALVSHFFAFRPGATSRLLSYHIKRAANE